MRISRGLALTLLASCLVLALIYSTSAQPACPSNCSGHGTCHSGICICDATHGGVDCSYNDQVITPGTPLSGSTSWGKWQYYHFTLENSGVTGQDFSISINETARWSDCDVFVQRNAYPTRNTYLKVDNSASSNVVLSVPNAQFGTYYIGVYGFSFARCEFNIGLSVSTSCPAGCSGHGSCNRGVCTCDSGFAGSDCSAVGTQLTNGQVTSQISVARWKWMYYYVSITTPATYLRITLSQSSGDPDLYVKKSKLPTTTSWDYQNVTMQTTSIITVPTPSTTEKYYIGVFGFTPSQFTIKADWDVASGTQLTCPSACSKHGTCNDDSTCTCNPGFSGSKCQNSTSPLVVGGAAATGYVAQNDWNYYYFSYMTAEAVTISVSQGQNTNSDCDVYVRKNATPTRFQFDYYSISPNQNFTVVIPSPGSNTWWIGVFGWWPCNYTLSLADSKGCSCGTGNTHGTCRAGSNLCICNPGWAGTTCSSLVTGLVNKAAANDLVGFNQWDYYSITVPAGTTNVGFFLKETDGSNGFVFLYVTAGGSQPPSLLSSDYKDVNTNTSIHSINIQANLARPLTYNIGVYGSPYQPISQSVHYSLVTYFTPF